MVSTVIHPQVMPSTETPTVYLTQADTESLSHLDILRLVQVGFSLNRARAMVASSGLYTSRKLLERITGTSLRAIQRQSRLKNEVRLTAQQSAVVFQYAKALEVAVSVFGSQALAEQWLNRPCRHLAGIVPFEMIDTSLGYNVVVEYLERIRLGIYQ